MHHLLESPGIEFVWLIDEAIPGVIVQRNTYFSIIKYVVDDVEELAVISNDDFEVTGQIGYEEIE